MLKAAIFGFGKMGRFHREVIDASGLARVAAVADPAPGAAAFPHDSELQVFSDPAELLAGARPDVVHVVTPPPTHFELARLALLRGAHIYVEKPFTGTADQARALFAIAARSGLKICAGHQLLFHPATLKADRLFASIGGIVHIESFFSFRQVRRDISALDQLLDILPHPVYLLLHFLEKGGASIEKFSGMIKCLDVRDDGELRLLAAEKDFTGSVTVSLRGRPVDSYVKITGTKGSLAVNYVRGTVIKSEPGAVALLASPYKEAVHTAWQSGATFALAALSRKHRYQGLSGLIAAFHRSIIAGGPEPVSEQLVTQCAALGELVSLKAEYARSYHPPPALKKDFVIVTGGTGFLGRKVVGELAAAGHGVRVLARKLPAAENRIAGVDYLRADLAGEPDPGDWEGAGTVVHCAAATYGDRQAHEKNTIIATRKVLQAASRAGITKIVHISSLGVLDSGCNGAAVSERTPVKYGDMARGPYVWAKSEAERIVIETGRALGLQCRIIRPGPLVDYESFQPPGRLGRRIGPFFIAVGNRKSALNICEVVTAGRVIAACVSRFDEFPAVLNLVEDPPPARIDLARRLARSTPGLTTVWVPGPALAVMSSLLKITVAVLRPGKQPPDIKKIFASESYDLSLANKIMKSIKAAT